MSVRLWSRQRSANKSHHVPDAFITLIARFLLRVYLPVMLIFWLGVMVVLWLEQGDVETRFGMQGVKQLLDVEADWLILLDESAKDLQILADHQALQNWLREGDEKTSSDLNSAMYYFSESKRIYDQVRFTDAEGMERALINYDEDHATIVSKAALQSVSHRSYFSESMKMNQGEIYLSPLSLSKESFPVETSDKPAIHMATPFFFNGKKRGMVVLGLSANYLFSSFKRKLERDLGSIQVLSKEGSYLYGTDTNQGNGLVYTGTDKVKRFANYYPTTWSGISQSKTGFVYEKGRGHAFRKIQLPSKSRNGIKFGVDREIIFLWIIPRLEVAQDMKSAQQVALIIGFGISLLLLFFLLFFVKVVQSNQRYQYDAIDLKARLKAVMDTASDAILSFDSDGLVNSYNMATLRMFACDARTFSMSRLQDLIPDGEDELDQLLQKQLSTPAGAVLNLRREFNAKRFNDEWFPLELSLTETIVNGRRQLFAIARDISDRKATEEQIHRKVLFDDLTNLPNRILLRTKLESLITLSQRRKTYGALLFMDLDNFKNINDSMGHLTGDILLCRVAERLTNSLRSEDVVSRLGGDEFVVVLPMLDEDQNQASVTARDVAEKLRQALNQPVLLDGHEYVITPSIGVVLLPSEGTNADDLLRQADTAMYRAKASGRNTIRFFHPSMQAEVNDRLRVGKELRQAIERGELELYLQPQVDVEFACIVGAEALIRWNHPVRGLLAPAAFISHAEELGLIGEIGEWTLREGFSILQRLLKERPCPGLESLAINISPRHFRSPLFLSRLKALMQEFNMPAHRIELEITENLLLEDVEEAVVKMDAVKALGVRFAIDDFGTGFSSLAYLKRLPVGRLKIDRSFITDVNTDTHNAAIVETILAMAKIQQLAVTAEGVEQIEEKTWLMDRGCSHIQGYLYSRPLTVDSFIQFCNEFSDKSQLPVEAGIHGR
ncbi:MAG: EAL domain-containing protein [Candidatus Thiodiazotropha sp. (ex Semelilucina semeliformis)]|nr:EAL domain-containing protein [Candidatus Thiodiazotropha sp. (ex Semelilucina semeliformis)]